VNRRGGEGVLADRPVVGGVAVLLLCALLGCAEGQRSRTELEEANEAFAKSIRWSDLRGVGQRVAPERRAEFLALAAKDETSLKVTDYELEDVQLSSDKAIVHSRVSWYFEPSVVTKTEIMTVLWEQKGGTWVIAAIVGGPLPLPPRR
jgi:hypothetical protein